MEEPQPVRMAGEKLGWAAEVNRFRLPSPSFQLLVVKLVWKCFVIQCEDQVQKKSKSRMVASPGPEMWIIDFILFQKLFGFESTHWFWKHSGAKVTLVDGDKSSIMVMEPPSPQCVGMLPFFFSKSNQFTTISESFSEYYAKTNKSNVCFFPVISCRRSSL